jgi:hypothetical protein
VRAESVGGIPVTRVTSDVAGLVDDDRSGSHLSSTTIRSKVSKPNKSKEDRIGQGSDGKGPVRAGQRNGTTLYWVSSYAVSLHLHTSFQRKQRSDDGIGSENSVRLTPSVLFSL